MIPYLYDKSAQKENMFVTNSYGRKRIVQQTYSVQMLPAFVSSFTMLGGILVEMVPSRTALGGLMKSKVALCSQSFRRVLA
jgi:hypothetical protein